MALRDPRRHASTIIATRQLPRSQTVRNLTVADLHTYYVLAGASYLLVHNCEINAISLGKQTVGADRDALDIFAMERGAPSYKNWGDSAPWYKQLQGFLTDGKTRIHVNLDGIEEGTEKAYARSGADVDVTDPAALGATRWEMYQLSTRPSAWNRVTWYREGREVGNPFE
jgi:hypothetical protein